MRVPVCVAVLSVVCGACADGSDLSSADSNDCARIVRTVSAFDFHGHFCIVMVRLGRSLLHWRQQQHLSLSRLPAALGDTATLMIRPLRKLVIQLLSSLLFLHRRGVIHADMKPENVLSDDALTADRDGAGREDEDEEERGEHDAMNHAGRFRLVDFGNAMLLENASLYYDDFEVQSLCYRAPEVLLGLEFGCPIGYADFLPYIGLDLPARLKSMVMIRWRWT